MKSLTIESELLCSQTDGLAMSNLILGRPKYHLLN